MATRQQVNKIFKALDLGRELKGANAGGEWFADSGDFLDVVDPTTGAVIARVEQASAKDYEKLMRKAEAAFVAWRDVPAPRRGEVVRQLGEALRAKKEALGQLVSLEMGKILTEGLGEVQEMIDICDYAVGQSRMLSGPTLQSERPRHRMMEQWHPLGVVGVITAFNFPVAVWAWNNALAWVCGDVAVWKPSSKTPLCAIACQNIANEVFRRNGVPQGVSCVVIGRGAVIGERLVADERVPLISATGSTRMGKRIGAVVGERLGSTILELGGNNALIISEKADLTCALASAFFGAVGTAGQRCTSTRRLIIHESIYDVFLKKLVANYSKVRIGDPLDPATLMGPLIDEGAVADYEAAIKAAKEQGGRVLYGGKVLEPPFGHRLLRRADHRRDRQRRADRADRDLRAHPLRHEVPRLRRGAGPAQRRAAGAVVGHLHRQRVRGRDVHQLPRLGLRHRQREHRHLRRGDRRRLRRREGDRRRPRVRLRLLEDLHAPPDQHDQLGRRGPPGAGSRIPPLIRADGAGNTEATMATRASRDQALEEAWSRLKDITYDREAGFEQLIKHRVRNILLVASLYDAFTLEEGGRLTEVVLRGVPRAEPQRSAPDQPRHQRRGGARAPGRPATTTCC